MVIERESERQGLPHSASDLGPWVEKKERKEEGMPGSHADTA